MKHIEITSDILCMPWHIEPIKWTEIVVADTPFAKGGYGELFTIQTNLNSKGLAANVQWVLKLCQADIEINKSGFDRMRLLASHLKEWQLERGYDVEQLFMRHSSLLGFPQGLFMGKVEGKLYYCYIMPDLRSLGYIELPEVLETEEFQTGVAVAKTIEDRLIGLFGLSKTLSLLLDDLHFIHGDLKPESIWYHSETAKLALIDYDGGTFQQGTFRKLVSVLVNLFEPKIMGAIQPWLAPEIMKEVNEQSNQAKMKVSSQSDAWAFACCVFHLLTGMPPFEFLEEDSYQKKKQYLANNEWPSLSNNQDAFSVKGEEATELEQLLRLHEGKNQIWKLWSKVFNKGFKNLSQRSNYRSWSEAIEQGVTEKKPLVRINIEPAIILEGNDAVFSWSCVDAHLIVNDINKKATGNESLVLVDYPNVKVVNQFGDWPVTVPLEIVRKPQIRTFVASTTTVKIGNEVQLTWDIQYVDRVQLHVNGDIIEPTESQYRFVPDQNQEITLRVSSKYNLHVEVKAIVLTVVRPVEIDFFTVDREFIAETLPVTFSWRVQNADHLSITNVDRVLEAKGEVKLRPKVSGEVTLRAKNQFFSVERSIYIEVLPVPKIDNLSLPQLPKMNLEVPDLISGAPRLLEHLGSTKSVFKKIFDHDIF